MIPDSIMWPVYLLAFFLTQEVTTAASHRRRSSSRSRITPTLIQGDIAVPEAHHGTGQELSAFLAQPSALWPRGVVYFWIETDEWEGVEEPVFTNEGLNNITQAHNQITEAVPCIEFR